MKNAVNSILSVFIFVVLSLSVFAQAAIEPSTAYSNDNLVCSISGANSGLYLYEWYENGQKKSYTSNTVPASATEHFDVWNCKMFIPPTIYTGKTQVGEATITISNAAPDYVDAFGPYTGTEGIAVDFTADASDSIDNDAITSWQWDFGDGVGTSTEQNPTYTYAQNGTYLVNLTVADEYGATATTTTTAVIDDTIPTADAGVDQTVVEGDLVTFDGSASIAYDVPITYAWDFGDGNTGVDVNPTNTYAQNGTYVVTLTVTDADGSINVDTMTVTVTDTVPTADFSASENPATEGVAVDFTDLSTGYVGDQPYTYFWDFGDGVGTSTEQNPTYTFAQNGTYVVNLTITDIDGSQDYFEMTIDILDTVPTI
ncbi:PKD domain-containing protein, partial [Candidatus Woesearchaeota archaeon]|nr:PKD domain-containing protein [Candidatus Woesearchaeota archaeon]